MSLLLHADYCPMYTVKTHGNSPFAVMFDGKGDGQTMVFDGPSGEPTALSFALFYKAVAADILRGAGHAQNDIAPAFVELMQRGLSIEEGFSEGGSRIEWHPHAAPGYFPSRDLGDAREPVRVDESVRLSRTQLYDAALYILSNTDLLAEDARKVFVAGIQALVETRVSERVWYADRGELLRTLLESPDEIHSSSAPKIHWITNQTRENASDERSDAE